MRKRLQSLALASAAAAAIAGPAAAGVIISPKSVTILTGGTAAGYDATNIINQSGLSKRYVSGVTDFDTYIATNPLHAFDAGEWLSEGPTTSATVLFDFGELVEITGLAFFNEDATSMDFITFRAGNSPTSLSGYGGSSVRVQNPFGVDYGPTVVNHQSIRRRYFAFNITGCNAAGAAHNGCGLGEVVFESSQAAPPPGGAVPEPATWAMMIMGFMGTGVAIRRRRQGFAAA
ncbi:PEPxxWA-CTERM sorting domain-containing protein [Phenylobacterium kunshanense]|uniref:PEPxxWA-CTERM sorting domain-containing protein n=1 Tax=Phenylobacterium kunshanense TaxID=1445034 RepID=UPI00197BB28A|nr:PEPxxWA-CTERM sorting domain-containing protein [Phenylobacterium kunshanense]